jgi:hypothetical protein
MLASKLNWGMTLNLFDRINGLCTAWAFEPEVCVLPSASIPLQSVSLLGRQPCKL